MTNTLLQDRWGKAADQFTQVPWVLLQKSGNCPPFKGVEVKLTAPQQLLLIQLISFWWLIGKGHPFPSYSALARRTGMSKKTIGSHLIQLEKKGWLKRIKRWQEGNSYSGWYYDLDPTVRRLAWLTNLPQEKEQIPEASEAEAHPIDDGLPPAFDAPEPVDPALDDGLPDEFEAPVEVMPEPIDPTLQEARLELLTQVKRHSNVERPEQRAERVKQLTEIREQRDKATPSLEDIKSMMAFDD